MRVLPHSHEWLQEFLYNPPLDPGVPGKAEWVGPAPRLSTEDAGTSYADIQDYPTNSAYPSVTFAPVADLTMPLRARVQIRVPDLTTPQVWQFTLGWEDDPLGWDTFGTAYGLFTVTSSEWETHEFDVDISPESFENLRDNYAPLGLMSAFVAYGDSDAFQVSLIQVMDGGASARPLRWRQRSDGLGGSSPKAARGVTSQQGSNRHRRYL